jgi:hypothetical protein
MESTGTYGDPLRAELASVGLPVVRVSGKAAKDHAEAFDGATALLQVLFCARCHSRVAAACCSLGRKPSLLYTSLPPSGLPGRSASLSG